MAAKICAYRLDTDANSVVEIAPRWPVSSAGSPSLNTLRVLSGVPVSVLAGGVGSGPSISVGSSTASMIGRLAVD